MRKASILTILACLLATTMITSADTIRGINMDFVTIDNAGNTAGSGGYGAVSYDYRIGKYEVTNAQWSSFVTVAGAPTGNPSTAYDTGSYFTGAQQPANNVSWYEAAQFCNYLTSGDKSKGAYQFSGNNTNPGDFLGINREAAKAAYGTIYYLPTESEWYKAAYYKPTNSGYSFYANGLNTLPAADNGWNYSGGAYSSPWDVGTGTMEQNGTYDMMGNIWEWNEALMYDSINRCLRGGTYRYTNIDLTLFSRVGLSPNAISENIGFRVASVIPEPASAIIMMLGAVWMSAKRRR